ncbi:MAG: Na+/H+ antiporter NhaA [Sphingobacteriales bacterium]|nr:MAG: Na+/H+ antiporter NhaA [Sphingobacteriales bacterium]
MLSKLFRDFFNSEKAGGLILIICSVVSLLLANSFIKEPYISFWNNSLNGHSYTHWINDGLMAIFFLLIGLELEREVYTGELSTLKKAMFPAVAALGGVLIPATIYLIFNYGTPFQSGAGIPMATDIAFAIGMLSLLGNKVPVNLKIFITALAVIDDLLAIIVIAVFYSSGISSMYLLFAAVIFAAMLVMNKLKVYVLFPYLVGGFALWYCMLHSGVHATIAGVLTAFAIPFGNAGKQSPSYKLQHFLHKPVAFIIVPLFALANTALYIAPGWVQQLQGSQGLGIITGLVVGKPVGILLFSFIAVWAGLCQLPSGLKWKHIAGTGMLAGIGFTMSIFVALLAFDNELHISTAKISIIVASVIAATIGLVVLKIVLRKAKKEI